MGIPTRSCLPPAVVAALLLAAAPVGASAQAGATADAMHVCDDCHGSHDAGPGASGLVRQGWSSVAPMAPGLGPVSERCLQCHGTPGDRQEVDLLGRRGDGEATFLGGSLLDDHPLGTAGAGAPGGDPGAREVVVGSGSGGDPLGLTGPELGGSVECRSCHDPHAPAAVMEQSQAQDDVCLGCHDPALDYNAHGIASCGSCHRQHGAPDSDHYLREPDPDYLCGACHLGSASPFYSGIEAIPGTPLHDTPSDPDCKACHAIH